MKEVSRENNKKNDQQLSFCEMYDGGGVAGKEKWKIAVQQEKHPHKTKRYKI